MAGGTGSSHYQQRKTGRSRRGTPCCTYRLSVVFCRVRPQGAPCFFYYASSFSTRSIRYPTPTWVWIRCGASGHRSKFFAQGCHINTQGGNVIFLRASPYLLCDGCMRQHLAHIMRQHTQQFVLDGGQMQFILTQPDAPGREVDFQRTIDKNRAVYAVRSQQIQSALRYTQSCQQLVHGKTALSDNRLRRCPMLRSYQNPRSGHSGR